MLSFRRSMHFEIPARRSPPHDESCEMEFVPIFDREGEVSDQAKTSVFGSHDVIFVCGAERGP